MSDCETIIEVSGLSKAYSREKPPIYAVYHASFIIRKGETLGNPDAGKARWADCSCGWKGRPRGRSALKTRISLIFPLDKCRKSEAPCR